MLPGGRMFHSCILLSLDLDLAVRRWMWLLRLVSDSICIIYFSFSGSKVISLSLFQYRMDSIWYIVDLSESLHSRWYAYDFSRCFVTWLLILPASIRNDRMMVIAGILLTDGRGAYILLLVSLTFNIQMVLLNLQVTVVSQSCCVLLVRWRNTSPTLKLQGQQLFLFYQNLQSLLTGDGDETFLIRVQ